LTRLVRGSDHVISVQPKPLAEFASGAVAAHHRGGSVGFEAGDRRRVAVQECRHLVRHRPEDRLRFCPSRDERRDPPQGRLFVHEPFKYVPRLGIVDSARNKQ
jgi:hypothetical protein